MTLSHYYPKKAFSLVEFVLILLISSILISLSIPVWQQFLIAQQQKTLRSRLLSAIHYARSQAIAQDIVVALCGSNDGIICNGQWRKGLLIKEVKNNKTLRFWPILVHNITFTWRSSFGQNQALKFQPDGMTQGQQGRFIIESAFRRIDLVLLRTGRVRVEHVTVSRSMNLQ